jgi:hypothetical protein
LKAALAPSSLVRASAAFSRSSVVAPGFQPPHQLQHLANHLARAAHLLDLLDDFSTTATNQLSAFSFQFSAPPRKADN